MPVKLLLELSLECESLARSEALSAVVALGGRSRVICEDHGVLALEADIDASRLASRLGLCHCVDELLGSCGKDDIDSFVENLDVPGPIRVRSTKVGETKVDLAATSRRVGGILGRRKGVDLHHPASDVRIIFSGKVYVGRMLGAVDRPSFERRKNRHMPFVYPASLHPKYARALVNLTQVHEGGRLLDPFCGTGAIVAEAFLIGLRAVGSDVSVRMIDGARRNLVHLKANADLRVSDVGDISEKIGPVEGIATDPPYGRSTSTDGEKISVLLDRAFAAFSDVLGRGARVSIVVPDLELIQGVRGFRLLETHSLWVHRSLTRRFCVLEKV